MDIQVGRNEFNAALASVIRAIEKRSNIPVLTGVMLSSDGAALTMRGTNLDMEMTTMVSCENAGAPASIVVPARQLTDIVKRLDGGALINLRSDDKGLAIRSGATSLRLGNFPVDDFPGAGLLSGESPWTCQFSMTAASMRRLFGLTQFAISTEEWRYYLNGVFLHVFDGKLRAVATDGDKLAQVDEPLPAGAEALPSVIVPRAAVAELLKLIAKDKSSLHINVNAAHIEFVTAAGVLLSKIVAGTFPDYMRIIPSGNDKRLVVDKKPFMAALKRVGSISSERGPAIKMEFSENACVLSVKNPDMGSISERLAVEYDAEPLAIGFNTIYMLDCLAAIEGDIAVIHLADAGSPALFRPRGVDGALFVLMPFRV